MAIPTESKITDASVVSEQAIFVNSLSFMPTESMVLLVDLETYPTMPARFVSVPFCGIAKMRAQRNMKNTEFFKELMSPSVYTHIMSAPEIVLITEMPVLYQLFVNNLPEKRIFVIDGDLQLCRLFGTPAKFAEQTKIHMQQYYSVPSLAPPKLHPVGIPIHPSIHTPFYPLQQSGHATHIIDNLYVGDSIAAGNKAELSSKNIGAIVNCTRDIPNAFEDNGILYMRVPIDDAFFEIIEHHFDSTFAFIDEQLGLGKSVMIHCLAGISRSVTIATAYLMRKRKLTSEKALALITSQRPQASPNLRFAIALDNFEKTLGL